MSEQNDGGSDAAMDACSKSRGECRKVGLRRPKSRPELDCDCQEATDMAEEIGHVGAAEAARGARDALISHRQCSHPPTTIANIASRRRAQTQLITRTSIVIV